MLKNARVFAGAGVAGDVIDAADLVDTIRRHMCDQVEHVICDNPHGLPQNNYTAHRPPVRRRDRRPHPQSSRKDVIGTTIFALYADHERPGK